MKARYVIILILGGTWALRADTPIQLSLTPDAALYPPSTMVKGLSLGIWSENPQAALTLGFVNGSAGDSGGFSLGIVNYSQSYEGVQFGAINISMENFVGWQHGYVNIAQGTFKGFALGLVNVGEEVTGFQLGAFNFARKLNGLQIGFLNVALNNPVFEEFPDKLAPGFPVLNWSF